MDNQFDDVIEDIFDDEDVNIDNYYLILEIHNQKYAIPIRNIYQIIQINEVTEIPDSPDFVRGLVKSNNDNIRIIDTRRRLQIQSLESELDDLIETMKQREQDQRNWLAELENSVKEKREFKLTTDPHACKFGVWYDNFQTSNQTLATFLARFDQPHHDIDGVAIKVKEHVKKDEYETALNVVHSAKHRELKRMIDLFNRLYVVIKESNREIAILVNDEGKKIAFSVDNIDKINYFTEEEINWGNESKYIDGHTNFDGKTVLILNENIYRE